MIKEVAELCRSFGAKKVILYGSRAMGNARERSDIDIAVKGVEDFDLLREKVDDNLIKKTRYIIPLEDGHMGELDVFGGVLDGLYFIEVEFESEEDAGNFVPPVWFGENVSDDKRYANSYLSKCNDLSVFL